MWEKVRLGDVLTTTSGGTPSRSKKEFFENGNIPWILSGDLYTKEIRSAKNFITDLGLKYSSAKLFPKNTLLIAMYGATIGQIGVLRIEASTNQAICGILPSQKFIPEFLYYYFLSIQSDLISKGLGNAQPNISQGIINNLQIPLPPLPVQQRIADMLDKADTLRHKDQELLKKYDELAQAIFIDMFGEYLNQNLTTLFDEIVINPSKKEVTINNDSKVSFIPMAHVGETGELNLTLSKSYEEVRTGFTYFRENDVLFAKITPCMENGKGAIARNLVRGIGFGSTEFHVLRPNEKIVAEFIYYWLSMPKVRKDAELNMTGSAGQKRVPVNFFSKLYFSVPPIELQRQFATRIEIINQLKAEANAEKSEELFQSLLQRVFKSALVK